MFPLRKTYPTPFNLLNSIVFQQLALKKNNLYSLNKQNSDKQNTCTLRNSYSVL